MKKTILSICMALPLCTFAQNDTPTSLAENDSVRQTVAEPSLSIAVFSYEKCWNAMPELAMVKAEVDALRDQYVAELKRAEADFNDKYEGFLEEQSKLAESIRNKRQAELQKIVEENLAFKAKSQETLANTEAAKVAPLKEKLMQVVGEIGKEGNYNMVINRDNCAVPYIDNVKVVDVTDAIIAKLK